MDRLIKLNLPEFAFVESSGHDGDALSGRNIILHVRTASIIEILPEDRVFLNDRAIRHSFTNTNIAGGVEYLTAFLHYTATLDEITDKREIIERVLIPAAKWYCAYCDWEDMNILG